MDEHRREAQEVLARAAAQMERRLSTSRRSSGGWWQLAVAGVHALLAISEPRDEGVISERELAEARRDPEVVATLDEADRVRDPDQPIFTPPKLDQSMREGYQGRVRRADYVPEREGSPASNMEIA